MILAKDTVLRALRLAVRIDIALMLALAPALALLLISP